MMADDLASQLADAIVKAAIRAAGNHSDYSPNYVRETLATDLRRILETSLPEWYAGYEAGCREQTAADAPVHLVPEGWEPDDDAYSAPDYTPDERHRHTIGGQTWEHAHRDGHEAHSAVTHDLSGAALIGTPEPRRRIPESDLRAYWPNLSRAQRDFNVDRHALLAMVDAGWRVTPPEEAFEREEQAERDAAALDTIFALLAEGSDLNGLDSILAVTGREVSDDDLELCECPSRGHEDGCEYAG